MNIRKVSAYRLSLCSLWFKFYDTAISRQVTGAHLKGGVDGNDCSSNLNAIKI